MTPMFTVNAVKVVDGKEITTRLKPAETIEAAIVRAEISLMFQADYAYVTDAQGQEVYRVESLDFGSEQKTP